MKTISSESFFNSYFRCLEAEGIRSIILHSYHEYPSNFPSDIDYCVANEHIRDTIKFLDSFCLKQGWAMVQIMQHEAHAYYCVCLSKDNPYHFLQLDVCGDYLREGKHLIGADSLLVNRKKISGQSFHIPATETEFLYILWKGIAKNKTSEEILSRLKELYIEKPEICQQKIEELSFVNKGEKFLDGMEELLKKGRFHYRRLPKKHPILEVQRKLQRIVKPSGLLVYIPATETAKNLTTIKKALEVFEPVFRATKLLEDLFNSSEVKAILRSTLVVTTSKVPLIYKKLLLRGDAYIEIDYFSLQGITSSILQHLEQRNKKKWKL